jgi:hypothetical protein
MIWQRRVLVGRYGIRKTPFKNVRIHERLKHNDTLREDKHWKVIYDEQHHSIYIANFFYPQILLYFDTEPMNIVSFIHEKNIN